jgi:hypothetical protein
MIPCGQMHIHVIIDFTFDLYNVGPVSCCMHFCLTKCEQTVFFFCFFLLLGYPRSLIAEHTSFVAVLHTVVAFRAQRPSQDH